MRPTPLLGLLAALLLPLAARDQLVIRQPIGEPVTEDLSSKLNGVWRSANGNLSPGEDVYRVRWRGEGRLKVAETNPDKDEKPETQTVLVTKLKRKGEPDERFAHFPRRRTEDDGAEQKRWTFARITIAQAVVLLAIPRFEVFAEAVQSGELAGRVKSGDGDTVDLKGDAEALNQFIASRPVQDLFMVEQPIIFRRDNGEAAKAHDAATDGSD
jgi:hypothetical protein